MSFESEIFTRLSGHAGLSNLIGARIYPVRMPQDVAMPAISYGIVSASRPSNFGVDTGDVRYRLQIDCWSSSLPGETGGANKVAAQVKAALKRYSGGDIQDCFLENEQSLYDDDSDLYRVIMDFIVWFKE